MARRVVVRSLWDRLEGRQRQSLLAVGIIGTALALWGAAVVRYQEGRTLNHRFQRAADEITVVIQHTLHDKLLIAESVRYFLDASDCLSSGEFGLFVEPFLRHDRVYRILAYAPRITGEERDAFEVRGRRPGLEQFQITDLKGDVCGQFVRAPRRDAYLPLFYIAPSLGNESWFGHDIGVCPVLGSSLASAVATGRTTLHVQALAQAEPEDGSLLLAVFVPVYERDRLGEVGGSGPEKLRGLVYGQLDVSELIQTSLVSHDLDGMLVELGVSSETGTTWLGRPVAVSAGGGLDVEAASAGGIVADAVFSMGDREFRVRSHATDAYLGAHRGWAWLEVLGAGGLLTILLLGYLWIHFMRAAVVKRQVDAQTATLKEINTELVESQARLDTVVKAAQDAIMMLDASGNISMWNASAERIFGYSEQEALGQNLHMLLAPKRFHEAFRKAFTKFCRSGQGDAVGKIVELSALRKGGHEFPIELSLSSVQIRGEWHAVGILRDISERKRAEEELKNALCEAEKLNDILAEQTANANHLAALAEMANAAKSRFLANMSHEIRTPMNGVMGMIDLALDQELLAEVREYLGTAKSSAEALLAIINDVLDISKIEASKVTIEQIDCALPPLLRDMEALMAPEADRKDLQFKILLDTPIPERICSDPTRIRQCLTNLLSNAIKFTAEGWVHVHVGVEDEGHVQFSVEDTGEGIPPDRIETIFQPFTQADEGTTRRFGGTGLGLTITRKLVDFLGGEIRVASESGKGSTSTFTVAAGVPLTGPEAKLVSRLDAVPEAATPATTVDVPQLSGRVLVAEDVAVNQKIAETLLRKVGLDVDVAANGREAVEMATANMYDLILMDIQMPEMNGHDATRTLRRKGVQVPIVALTASAMAEDIEECRDAGCDGHLAKPIDRAALYDVVERLLAGDGAGDPVAAIKTEVETCPEMIEQVAASPMDESRRADGMPEAVNIEETG